MKELPVSDETDRADHMIALLQDIANLLQQLVSNQPEPQRYCMQLIDPDGDEACPGGVAVAPSFFEGARRIDKWQHPLPTEKHKQMPMPKGKNGTYLRTHHGPFTSQTTLAPRTVLPSESVGGEQHDDDGPPVVSVDLEADLRVAMQTLMHGRFKLDEDGSEKASAAFWSAFRNVPEVMWLRTTPNGEWGEYPEAMQVALQHLLAFAEREAASAAPGPTG